MVMVAGVVTGGDGGVVAVVVVADDRGNWCW